MLQIRRHHHGGPARGRPGGHVRHRGHVLQIRSGGVQQEFCLRGQQIRRHRAGPELRPGAVRQKYQGQRHLPGQLPGRPPVERPGAGAVCPVPPGREGPRSEDRGGRAPVLRGQGTHEPGLSAPGRGPGGDVLRGAEVRDRPGHPRYRRTGHAELRAGR